MPNRCRTTPTAPGRPRACSARSCASTGPGAGLSQKDLAAGATVSHDVISKIETGERPPAGDFPPRLDAVPELDTRGALTRLRDHLKKGQKQRLYGWFQQWADIEAQATVLRWYEPLVVHAVVVLQLLDGPGDDAACDQALAEAGLIGDQEARSSVARSGRDDR